MNCHVPGETSLSSDAPVILVGNPNVGKSVIFGQLTGHYVVVSNYPGTTVEIAHGKLPDGTPLIDTPGTNTLAGNSDDERITRDVLLNHRGAIRAVIQVADAKNLCRALLLTSQLAELGVPMVLSLNMSDEAQANGITIDTDALSELLGIDVIPTVATQGKGLDRLQEAIRQAKQPCYKVCYSADVESAVEKVSALLPPNPIPRDLGLRLLSGDSQLAAQLHLNGSLTSLADALAANYTQSLRVVITHQQLEAARSLSEHVTSKAESGHNKIIQTLSGLTTHPVWGWPFLMLILFLVYKFVGEFGAGTLVGFMEKTIFGQWINPVAMQVIDHVLPIPFIHDLLVGQYGVITMALSYGIAIVLPIVATFFIAFSILEDTGYLPRLAIMLNWLFKSMGLNGKAVLPMVLGLGCDTMATMTTRVLETRKERIMVTLLLALGIPCSAQLGVIMGMLGILSGVGVLIWACVLLATMLIVGLLAAKLLPGERSDFILELPPLRLPRLSNILIKTLARMEWYLKEVLPLFILGTLILFVLDKTGALIWIEELAAPLVTGLLGLPKEAAAAFLIGFLRRDYGAAGLFMLALNGHMNSSQVLVSLIVITLFIPCIANVMIIIKEYGAKVATGVALLVFPLAFAIGGLVNLGLHLFQVTP